MEARVMTDKKTLEQRREELLAAAKSRPGVAEASRVFEAALKQSPSDGRVYRAVTRFATGGNA
jgi:hypothetical protein